MSHHNSLLGQDIQPQGKHYTFLDILSTCHPDPPLLLMNDLALPSVHMPLCLYG